MRTIKISKLFCLAHTHMHTDFIQTAGALLHLPMSTYIIYFSRIWRASPFVIIWIHFTWMQKLTEYATLLQKISRNFYILQKTQSSGFNVLFLYKRWNIFFSFFFSLHKQNNTNKYAHNFHLIFLSFFFYVAFSQV